MSVKLYKGIDDFFLECCKKAKTAPTHRQRKKWERGEGSAYKVRHEVTKDREAAAF